MRIIQTVPVLRIFDVATALHRSEHHADGSPGATVFLRMSGLLDFHAELEKKSYR